MGLITTGLFYQTHMTWYDAEVWFEEAFASALKKQILGPEGWDCEITSERSGSSSFFRMSRTKEDHSRRFLVSLVSKNRLEYCIWSKILELSKAPVPLLNSF